MSRMTSIIEGLSMIGEKPVNESYQDYPTSRKSRELQKVCSDVLNKKYLKLFKPFGAESVGVELYVHDDSDSDDVITINDAIYELTVYIDFDITKDVDIKAVQKVIASNLRNYPKFQFEKESKQFCATVEKYDDILDILSTLESDGCRIKGLYNVVTSDEIDRRVEAQKNEWKEERKYQEREYRRDVLGTW